MSDQKKSFKDTLNLPKTDFPIRANAKTKEPELLQRWADEKLCEAAVKKNEGNEMFTLQDGPPYANGHMHIGHALNRTLKDVVCKSKRMSGYHIISFPGWDCHGLPIELKVTKEQGEDSDRIEFKKKCREYAQKWIDIQREEIKRLGVVTDWDHPYITMSPGYEASILRCFADFVEKGYIERKGKTVPWCASCQTVLATAEIEYSDRKDPSCYILFPLEKEIANEFVPDYEVSLLVWTTTPWTIPLNRAVVLHPTAPYVILQGKDEKQAFIVAEQLADKICTEVGIEKVVLATIKPEQLMGKHAAHPYIENLRVPIILDEMVLLDDGTACVHSAPGCGPEDYLLGIKNGLEIFSPLSPDGKYTEGIQPAELEGMLVADGQIWSIKKMAELGRLLHKSSIKHSYPHCWRCHNPLIFRATDQWFCDLRKENLVERAIVEANTLTFVPEWGKTRLTSSMASRAEWCLSRQRQWGVPITAIMCDECGHAHIEPDFIRGVADHVSKEGVEFWDRITIEELVSLGLLQKDFTCVSCGNNKLEFFSKEMDIVDVWFESGVSHTAVQDKYSWLPIPADLYLEGSDQHRGWFQSSFLSSMILYGKTCTKSFLTHGYVLDAQGQKMSKSRGNVVSPQDLIERYSADILRLWVASSDFEDDIAASEISFKNASEVYRKIRNTCRFMISNLYDFDIKKDAVPFADLSLLDQRALATLQSVIDNVKKGYEEYWLTQVFHTLNRYCTNDLSAFYLDIVKDRLYTEQADGHRRRSTQTVMYHILDSLTRLMAPILSFLAEEVSDVFMHDKQGSSPHVESIHLQLFPESVDVWAMVAQAQSPEFLQNLEARGVLRTPTAGLFTIQLEGWWNLLNTVRPELLKAIEGQRAAGLVKHSLEVKLTVYVDDSSEQGSALQSFIKYVNDREDASRFFKDFVIVSQFDFVDSPEGLNETALPWLRVKVDHADGTKCPRCWQWEESEHEDGLCGRCACIID